MAMELSPNIRAGKKQFGTNCVSFLVHLVLENSALEPVKPTENVCMVLDCECLLFFWLENWKKKNPVCMSYSWLITCSFCKKNGRNAYCFSEMKTLKKVSVCVISIIF